MRMASGRFIHPGMLGDWVRGLFQASKPWALSAETNSLAARFNLFDSLALSFGECVIIIPTCGPGLLSGIGDTSTHTPGVLNSLKSPPASADGIWGPVHPARPNADRINANVCCGSKPDTAHNDVPMFPNPPIFDATFCGSNVLGNVALWSSPASF